MRRTVSSVAVFVKSSMGHHPPAFQHRKPKSCSHQCIGSRSVIVAFPGPGALEFGFVSSGKVSGGYRLRWEGDFWGLGRGCFCLSTIVDCWESKGLRRRVSGSSGVVQVSWLDKKESGAGADPDLTRPIWNRDTQAAFHVFE